MANCKRSNGAGSARTQETLPELNTNRSHQSGICSVYIQELAFIRSLEFCSCNVSALDPRQEIKVMAKAKPGP